MKNERAMYAISYGLFVLTARQGERDNGCIINTAVQVTAQPNRVTIAVNKGDVYKRQGSFAVTSKAAPAIRAVVRAVYRSSSLTIPPREVLTR